MRPLPLVLLLAAAPALAQGRAWMSTDGVLWIELLQGPGATLVSQEPVTYHVGAAAVPVTGIETVTFRADCTATSALAGEGTWARQGDGFWAGFVEGSGLWFEDQPPPLDAPC